jgi:hypothetical protein
MKVFCFFSSEKKALLSYPLVSAEMTTIRWLGGVAPSPVHATRAGLIA